MLKFSRDFFVRNILKVTFGVVLYCIGAGCTSVTESTKEAVTPDAGQVLLHHSYDSKSLFEIPPSVEIVQAFENLQLRKSSSSPVVLSLAELALLSGNVKSAVQWAHVRLKQDLEDDQARMVLVKAAIVEGRIDEAKLLVGSFQKDIKKNAQIYNLQGLVSYLSGDVQQAKEHWQAGLGTFPNDVSLMMNLGCLYFGQKYYAKSGVLFSKVLSIKKDQWDAKIGQALVLASEGKSQESKDMLVSVLNKNPKSSLALYNLAVLSRERFQEYAAALEYLNAYFSAVSERKNLLTQAVVLREELKILISNRGQPLSDEQLRYLLKNQSAATKAVEESAVDSGTKKRDD